MSSTAPTTRRSNVRVTSRSLPVFPVYEKRTYDISGARGGFKGGRVQPQFRLDLPKLLGVSERACVQVMVADDLLGVARFDRRIGKRLERSDMLRNKRVTKYIVRKLELLPDLLQIHGWHWRAGCRPRTASAT
jgi:hypothetical protein